MKNGELDELGKKLHAKLDNGLDKLKAAKPQLEKLHKETETAIREKIEGAQHALETTRKEAESAKKKIEVYVEEKKTETQSAVAEWKGKHDRKKLEKRAERAQNYADACIALALYSIEEAEVAILEAIAARKDADEAS